MTQRQVYVVDDDEQVRAALQRLLESAGHAVRCFDSAARCLECIVAECVACLVLDLAMPGQDGLQLQQLLLQRAPQMPVVFLTGRGDIDASVRAMKRGATDFLTKPVNDERLFAAVEAALLEAERRQARRQREEHLAAQLGALTAREREVLAQVLEGLLNKQIAAVLGTTEKTIKFHRGNLMRKMHARSVAELARRMAEAQPGAESFWTKVQ